MARKNAPIAQEELYPLEPPPREELDDARLVDLDVEQESPFLRGQKRVSVRRGSLPKKTANRLFWGMAALGVLLVAGIIGVTAYSYAEHSWRFRIESSDEIEIAGLKNVSRTQVMEVMGGDIGRNVLFVPLAQRQEQLQQIPWIESASVMRFLPNRLRVELHERTPIAFARVGSRILLADSGGNLMDLPVAAKKKYSFPVILGMNPGEPLSTRAPRMKIYQELVQELDSGGAHYSQDLSEVDLTDPDDVKVLANDPNGEVLIHLGSSNYLDRYKIYVAHLREWRQQFDKLESVDLRYDHQIIVNPDLRGSHSAPAPAVVQPAALLTREPAPIKAVARLAPARKAAARKGSVHPYKKMSAKSAPPAAAPPVVAKTQIPAANSAAQAKTAPPAPASNGNLKKPSPAIAKDPNPNQDHP